MKLVALLGGAFVVANLALAPVALACGDKPCGDKSCGDKSCGDAKKDGKTESAPKVFDSPQKEGVKAACPVSGEVFAIAKDTASSTYNGKYVYFCCPHCKGKFDKEPAKYLK